LLSPGSFEGANGKEELPASASSSRDDAEAMSKLASMGSPSKLMLSNSHGGIEYAKETSRLMPGDRDRSADVDGASAWDWGAACAIAGSSANLMATSMGTGMLALPIAIYYSGAITGTILIILMAVLSDMSLLFLVKAAQRSGKSSLQDIGRHYLGPNGEMAVNMTLVALLVCASLAILLAVVELVVPLWRLAIEGNDSTIKDHAWYCQQWFVMLVCVLLVYPISIPNNLKPLRYSSGGAVVSIFLVFIFLVIRFCQNGVTKTAPIRMFVDSPVVALALPIQFLSYCSQFNVVGLYDELGRHKKHINKVIHISVGITCTLYTLFGVLAYLYFGDETQKYSMILDGFRNDKLMSVAGCMIALTNILKFPLIILPFRNTVNHILFGEYEYDLVVSMFETLLLLIIIYFLAWLVGDLALGLELSGPTVGVFICFILPAMLYYHSEKEQMKRNRMQRPNQMSRGQITAVIVGLLGVLIAMATVMGLVFQETSKHSGNQKGHKGNNTIAELFNPF